jgi:heptosyltransferase I
VNRSLDLLGLATRLVRRRPAPPVDGDRLRSVVLVKLSSIGDVVHALPVAMALRRRYPRLRITWVVEPPAAPLIEHHPAVDRVVRLPPLAWSAPVRRGRGWVRLLREGLDSLRAEPYDAALDLQGLLKSSVVALLSRAPLRLGLGGQREGSHLVSATLPVPADPVHAVEEYLAAAEHLGAPARPIAFGLTASPAAIEAVARRMRDEGFPSNAAPILLAPSASRRRKNWPAARWSTLCEALPEEIPLILVGSTDHRRRHRRICGDTSRRVHDWTGRTSLPDLVATVARSRLVVAPDSAPAHIAAAIGRPLVGLYGPSDPQRLAPWGQAGHVVHHRELCGAGCPAYCPRGWRCLREVGVKEVLHRVRRVLAEGAVSGEENPAPSGPGVRRR